MKFRRSGTLKKIKSVDCKKFAIKPIGVVAAAGRTKNTE